METPNWGGGRVGRGRWGGRGGGGEGVVLIEGQGVETPDRGGGGGGGRRVWC